MNKLLFVPCEQTEVVESKLYEYSYYNNIMTYFQECHHQEHIMVHKILSPKHNKTEIFLFQSNKLILKKLFLSFIKCNTNICWNLSYYFIKKKTNDGK